MKKYLGHIFFFAFWILFFVFSKAVFLLYHFQLTDNLDAVEILKVFYYGLRMDFSFTGYICILPFILFLIRSLLPVLRVRYVIRLYSHILIIALSFLVTADLELYTAWGFRMDNTPLQYFNSPREMISTASEAPLFVLFLIFIILAGSNLIIYRKFIDKYIGTGLNRTRIGVVTIQILLIGLLIIPIRGGIQKIPINISEVYFSKNLYANQAAINLPWNIAFSFLNSYEAQNPFQYFNADRAEHLVDQLYNTEPPKITPVLIRKKPNIVLIILESFSAKWVGNLGGVPGVTPNLDSIADAGLLFTNIYSAGDRSEKGLVAILSGYPNQAITSIIKIPTKTMGLPSINQVLAKAGYESDFMYGGELEFANMKSYLINIGMDQLTGKYDFPIAQRTTSWGAHDQYVFDRFYNDILQKQEPFFATLFTLSSHEPYDVPMKPHFNGTDQTTLFKNSIYYTDSIVGDFVRKLKKTALWNNTLLVFVADHGHPLPGHDAVYAPSKFHIPLIFSGGALKNTGRVESIGSQTDIATTLLDQLNLQTNEFKWGKDLLDSAVMQFAFYSFNNGFGFVTPKGTVTVDNVSKAIIYADPGVDSTQIDFGKAYMQDSYRDFLNKKGL